VGICFTSERKGIKPNQKQTRKGGRRKMVSGVVATAQEKKSDLSRGIMVMNLPVFSCLAEISMKKKRKLLYFLI
jgi:hypothetical protein